MCDSNSGLKIFFIKTSYAKDNTYYQDEKTIFFFWF